MILKHIFYKLEFMKDNRPNDDDYTSESGYYITKRIWAWLLFSPVIVFWMMVKQIPAFIYSLFTYTATRINCETKKKLTMQQYFLYFNELSK